MQVSSVTSQAPPSDTMLLLISILNLLTSDTANQTSHTWAFGGHANCYPSHNTTLPLDRETDAHLSASGKAAFCLLASGLADIQL